MCKIFHLIHPYEKVIYIYSWECVRSQIQESSVTKQESITVTPSAANLAWCNAADEWDENDNGDSTNGNVMNVDNEPANGVR